MVEIVVDGKSQGLLRIFTDWGGGALEAHSTHQKQNPFQFQIRDPASFLPYLPLALGFGGGGLENEGLARSQFNILCLKQTGLVWWMMTTL